MERSPTLSFGSCVVELGNDLPWDELVRDTAAAKRAKDIPIKISSITQLGQFPPTPYPIVRDEKGVHPDATVMAANEQAVKAIQDDLSRRLVLSPKKEVLIYVHGFANTFNDSVTRLAELSFFLGGDIVPIAYTWPAGAGGGFLRAYQRDSESAEFTVLHLKNFIKAVAGCPDVRRVSILAHSRGNAVATAAVRELFLENGGAPAAAKFRERYKLHNAVLAAADLDLEVMEQRMAGEMVGLALNRITIYACESDKALGISGWLFGSLDRIGQTRPDDYEQLKAKLPNAKGFSVIDARVSGGFLSHSYFLDSPAVSSDLILVLRYDRDPGAENGRPLKKIVDNYWQIDDSYPIFTTESASPAVPNPSTH